MRGRLQLFATRSMTAYRDEVAGVLAQRHADLSDISGTLAVRRFADGEMEAELATSVRGRDIYLFAGSSRNPLGIAPEECKLETYHAIDALRRAQAGRITLFEPYCSAGRSDRLTRRNSVGLWVHFKTLVSLGIDHYITFQLHSEQSKSFLDPALCSVDDLPAHTLLKAEICRAFISSRERLVSEVRPRWLFCSVDAGGENLAKRFAASFGCGMVIAHKQRDYSSANRVESVTILSSDSIAGKVIWIVDDMIDTGSSVYALVQELARRDPAEINIAVVHPVLSPPAVERLGQLCDRRLVGRIVVVDSVPCLDEVRHRLSCLRVVSSVGLAADIIHRLNAELPMSPLLAPFDAWEYLGGGGPGGFTLQAGP
jgi:ribose-phosphate pyrophosphokinase